MKEKMITRTVTATVATVMVVEVKTAKVYTTTFTLTGSFKDNADILKAIKKNDTEDMVYAAITAVETKETLYGMSESMFMQYAKELPPRGSKES